MTKWGLRVIALAFFMLGFKIMPDGVWWREPLGWGGADPCCVLLD